MTHFTKTTLTFLLFLTLVFVPVKLLAQNAASSEPVSIREIEYGTSGSGQFPLTAYQLGNGKNVMVLSFAIHGWEDNWDADGAALVYLAEEVTDWLDENRALLDDGDWTVYVLPCLNPDGLYLGNSCNGPGRCTTSYFDEDGMLSSSHGIDMNRCFPYCFSMSGSARNYTSYTPLACQEAQDLAEFITDIKGSGYNILIDTHGWYNQVISSNGYGTLYNAFHDQFTRSSYASLYGCPGYFSSWAAYVEGYDSCLLELPGGFYSYEDFLQSSCVEQYENAIQDLLQNYNSPY